MSATCDICGKLYKTKRDLAVHRNRIHLNIYPYHCAQCGHGLQRKQWLATHRCSNVRQRQTRNRGPDARTEEASSKGKGQPKEDLLQRLMIDVDIMPREDTSETPTVVEGYQRSSSVIKEGSDDVVVVGGGNVVPQDIPVTMVNERHVQIDEAQFNLVKARSLLQLPPQPTPTHHSLSFSPTQPLPLLSSYAESQDGAVEAEGHMVGDSSGLRATDVPWADPTWPYSTE